MTRVIGLVFTVLSLIGIGRAYAATENAEAARMLPNTIVLHVQSNAQGQVTSVKMFPVNVQKPVTDDATARAAVAATTETQALLLNPTIDVNPRGPGWGGRGGGWGRGWGGGRGWGYGRGYGYGRGWGGYGGRYWNYYRPYRNYGWGIYGYGGYPYYGGYYGSYYPYGYYGSYYPYYVDTYNPYGYYYGYGYTPTFGIYYGGYPYNYYSSNYYYGYPGHHYYYYHNPWRFRRR